MTWNYCPKEWGESCISYARLAAATNSPQLSVAEHNKSFSHTIVWSWSGDYSQWLYSKWWIRHLFHLSLPSLRSLVPSPFSCWFGKESEDWACESFVVEAWKWLAWFTSSHILLARTQSHDHTYLQGRLAHTVCLCILEEKSNRFAEPLASLCYKGWPRTKRRIAGSEPTLRWHVFVVTAENRTGSFSPTVLGGTFPGQKYCNGAHFCRWM